jgi:hypothetical protein
MSSTRMPRGRFIGDPVQYLVARRVGLSRARIIRVGLNRSSSGSGRPWRDDREAPANGLSSAHCSHAGFGNPMDVASGQRTRTSQLMKFTFPLFRSYIAPTILIFPSFSKSAKIELLLRITPMVCSTFDCATASTNPEFLLVRSPS